MRAIHIQFSLSLSTSALTEIYWFHSGRYETLRRGRFRSRHHAWCLWKRKKSVAGFTPNLPLLTTLIYWNEGSAFQLRLCGSQRVSGTWKTVETDWTFGETEPDLTLWRLIKQLTIRLAARIMTKSVTSCVMWIHSLCTSSNTFFSPWTPWYIPDNSLLSASWPALGSSPFGTWYLHMMWAFEPPPFQPIK